MNLAPAAVEKNTKNAVGLSQKLVKMTRLLTIVELGGYPDLNAKLTTLGFDVIQANSMRKGLVQIKKKAPDVIIAQFIYGPTYGSQLSNFETLFAAMERHAPQAKLIALLEKDDEKHLQRLGDSQRVFRQFTYPLDTKTILTCLSSLLNSDPKFHN